MKIREKSNYDICKENDLPVVLATNVVEEKMTKNKIRATSELIAKTLAATLGPYGTSTIVQDPQRQHFTTKDGFDLMNKLIFEDEASRVILDLFRTTASNQVYNVGDGSTSAIIVANALFQALTDPDQIEHFKKIAPKDIMDILNDLSEMIEAKLNEMATPISEDMKELDLIAAVANNNDKETGKLIADIYRKIGKYGFIAMDTFDRYDKDEYNLESGIEWDRGYIDPIFAKNEKDNKIEYSNNPRVIISNSVFTYSDLEKIVIPMMKTALNQENAQLLIIANDYDEDVRTFFKANRFKHETDRNTYPMDFTPVDIDQVTTESKNKLKDLATLCGCRIYDKVLVKDAEVVMHPEEFVGNAGKITITPKKTQIVISDEIRKKNEKNINAEIKRFTEQINKLKEKDVRTTKDEEQLFELQNRTSRLGNSSAILHIGGKTIAERKSRQRLIEDAIFACKSALESGYIPGGNICIPKVLQDNKEAFASVLGAKYKYLPIESINSFFAYFIDMLASAFLESYSTVLSNSYLSEEEAEEIAFKCLDENKFYNLKIHEYEDFDKTVVINPVKTDIEILRSCISIIGMLSTSNQMITLNLNTHDCRKLD